MISPNLINSKLAKIYSPVSTNLKETIIPAIENDLLCPIKQKFSKIKSLIPSNVTTDEPYSLNVFDRIKDPASLAEKLIRKSILPVSADTAEIITEDFIYANVDDLLAYTLVTQTSSHNADLLEIVKDAIESNSKYQITSNPEQIYKVGELPYYKLKIQRKDDSSTINFELQIKSQFTFIYANIDHGFLYKNRMSSPNKAAVKVLMENTSNMLLISEKNIDQLSTLLYNYKEQADVNSEHKIILDFIKKNLNNEDMYLPTFSLVADIIQKQIVPLGSENNLTNNQNPFKRYTDNVENKINKEDNKQTILYSLFPNIENLFFDIIEKTFHDNKHLPAIYQDYKCKSSYNDLFIYILGSLDTTLQQKLTITVIDDYLFKNNLNPILEKAFDNANEENDKVQQSSSSFEKWGETFTALDNNKIADSDIETRKIYQNELKKQLLSTVGE
ncbi:hypothetical protein ACA578_16015 [Lactiplantibacillus plantarum]|uniref:hypothetical protein n=1 Tax=Lactiplantibacillus plantarum TaxID=1590 RepID=UPI003C1F4A26